MEPAALNKWVLGLDFQEWESPKFGGPGADMSGAGGPERLKALGKLRMMMENLREGGSVEKGRRLGMALKEYRRSLNCSLLGWWKRCRMGGDVVVV